jgi:hypothetical protein
VSVVLEVKAWNALFKSSQVVSMLEAEAHDACTKCMDHSQVSASTSPPPRHPTPCHPRQSSAGGRLEVDAAHPPHKARPFARGGTQ